MEVEESRGVVALFENVDSKKSSYYAGKVSLSQLLRGGVIVEVTNPEQARTAERAGALAVMAAEPLGPQGPVSRMPDPGLIRRIKNSVSIPIISRARIGHFVEAQILEAVGVDFIDESEILTPADDVHFINKHNFRRPFICGCKELGSALRRVGEGAALLRTEGGDGVRTGDVVDVVRNLRAILGDVRRLQIIDDDELYAYAKEIAAPFELVQATKRLGRLPVQVFAAGGIVTPADAAMLMQIGCDGVFVDSSVFYYDDPEARVRAFVQAVMSYNDSVLLAKVSSTMEEFEIRETDLVESLP